MTYEFWRISYQSSEAAARSAWQEMIRLHHRVNELEAQLSTSQPAAQGLEQLRHRLAAADAAAKAREMELLAVIEDLERLIPLINQGEIKA